VNIIPWQVTDMHRCTLFRSVLKTVIIPLVALWALTAVFIPSRDARAETVREPVIAGSWYPGDPQALREQVDGFLKKVESQNRTEPLMALIVPHAGYLASGPVAAHAYKLLERYRFDTVVIAAPSHYLSFDGVSVYDVGGYRTPLGIMRLDRELIKDLKQRDPKIRYVPAAHQREHSIEIQLPFIQMLLPEAKLVALVMGDQEMDTCRRLAQTLARSVQGKSVLLIASTDLSHYHSYDAAKQLDDRLMEQVALMDAEGLYSDLVHGRCEACGGGPMITVLLAAKMLGAGRSEILSAANSGDVLGDRRRVVGYMAAALWSQPTDGQSSRSDSGAPGNPIRLTEAEKKMLHHIARCTVDACLAGTAARLPDSLSPGLKQPAGAFVTLTLGGRLRGCIGRLTAKRSLAETVSEMAAAAATKDPRFPPVRKDEASVLKFEISVLSSLCRVSDMSRIQVGTHGIFIRNGYRSGVLLPQVAVEQNWDRVQFLEQTCRKAGLAKDSWRHPDTGVYIFSAEVF